MKEAQHGGRSLEGKGRLFCPLRAKVQPPKQAARPSRRDGGGAVLDGARAAADKGPRGARRCGLRGGQDRGQQRRLARRQIAASRSK
jgi:hypothetical protein